MCVTELPNYSRANHYPDRRYHWQVFRAFNAYRLILAAILLAAFVLDEQNRFLGKTNPALFLGTAITYIMLVILAIIGSYRRQPILIIQAHFQMIVDLVVLTIIIHVSGGLGSSLNTLLITAVAASSILLPLSSALLSAALGFFLLVGSWFLNQWQNVHSLVQTAQQPGSWIKFIPPLDHASTDPVRLGVMGAVLFIVAGLTYALAERARRSDALAQQRSLELLEAAEMNRGIIHHLQNGVIVVDHSGHVLLMNTTAQTLLDIPMPDANAQLEALSPPLWQRLYNWLSGGADTPDFRPAPHRPELIPRFTLLGDDQTGNVLVLLDDSEQVAERLHQIKLAALGRLTAGIAHEIRNPLAAISQAAQLLQEATDTHPAQRRLGEIIYNNVQRANRIISDVLDLARRDRSKAESFILVPWLEYFIEDFLRTLDSAEYPEIRHNIEPSGLQITFDPGQLRQVLWNLCSNACRHGTQAGEVPKIELRGHLDPEHQRPVLEVRDNGPGVAPEHVPRLFEPFFTTRNDGMGLGLYLTRELCEANRAQLKYQSIPEGGSCFRILFATVTPILEAD